MPFALPRNNIYRAALALALLIDAGLIAGCASAPPEPNPASVTSTHSGPPGTTPVARYGRYTLVELVPTGAQQDLMQQVIDVTIPATVAATVAEALRYVLLRSGYQLCDDREEIRA